jgi:hypothetical protein
MGFFAKMSEHMPMCAWACTWQFNTQFFLKINCNEITELLISYATHLFNAFELIEFYITDYMQSRTTLSHQLSYVMGLNILWYL